MSSIPEVDLVLTCKINYMKAKEEESVLSYQLKTLKAQKEEILHSLEQRLDNYHLATQVSETYTLTFDPSLRHDIDCKCYVERNKQLRKEVKNELLEMRKKILLQEKLHQKAVSALAYAKRRSETLDQKILQTHNAFENYKLNRKRMGKLEQRKYLVKRQKGKETDVKIIIELEKVLDQIEQEIVPVKRDSDNTKLELSRKKKLLTKYTRYLNGYIDIKGRRIQTPVQNA